MLNGNTDILKLENAKSIQTIKDEETYRTKRESGTFNAYSSGDYTNANKMNVIENIQIQKSKSNINSKTHVVS